MHVDYDSCYFPFIYDGIAYSDCISGSHSARWCSTTARFVSLLNRCKKKDIFKIFLGTIITKCGVTVLVCCSRKNLRIFLTIMDYLF